jgi:hypothetical protein
MRTSPPDHVAADHERGESGEAAIGRHVSIATSNTHPSL